MTPGQRTQAEYVAEHLLGWELCARPRCCAPNNSTRFVTPKGWHHELGWLLTGDGMLAILESLKTKFPFFSFNAVIGGGWFAEMWTQEAWDALWNGSKDENAGGPQYFAPDGDSLLAAVLAAAYQALLDSTSQK